MTPDTVLYAGKDRRGSFSQTGQQPQISPWDHTKPLSTLSHLLQPGALEQLAHVLLNVLNMAVPGQLFIIYPHAAKTIQILTMTFKSVTMF